MIAGPSGRDRPAGIRYIDPNSSEDNKMADHKHGEMDTTVQEETFNGFVTATIRVVIVCILILLFLAVFNS